MVASVRSPSALTLAFTTAVLSQFSTPAHALRTLARGRNATGLSAAGPTFQSSPLRTPDAPHLANEAHRRHFASAELTPVQFLLISSPDERKVVYTQLRDFRSATGRTFTLIDTGLLEPCVLAFDRQRGKLYVADRLQKAVFRYSIVVHRDGGRYSLQTDGTRLTVLVNRQVGGISVDTYGTVFFTDEVSQSVNKITAEVMDLLVSSTIAAEDLNVISEQELEAAASFKVGKLMNATPGKPRDPLEPVVKIQALYEAALAPHVTTPTGIASDGMRLFWTNAEAGNDRGVVVEGQVYPRMPLQPAEAGRAAHFPAAVVANNTNWAHSLVQTGSMLLFSGDFHGSGTVFGISKSGGHVFHFVSGLGQPRGLVWDGDNTVFVADAAASQVYSFPVSRFIDGAPATQVVGFNGCCGLALISHDDQAWDRMRAYPYSGERVAACPGAWAAALALLAAAAAGNGRGFA